MIVPRSLEKVEEASLFGQRFTFLFINLERIKLCQVLRIILPVDFCGLCMSLVRTRSGITRDMNRPGLLHLAPMKTPA